MIHILGTDILKELYNMPVYLYGGGSTGKVLGGILRNKGIIIRGYIDDDPAKWGGCIDDVQILPFSSFVDGWGGNSDVAILMASIYAKPLLNKLARYNNMHIYDMFDYYSKEYDITTQIFKECSDENLAEFKNRCSRLFPHLSDEESVDVLKTHYEYLCHKDLSVFFDICSGHEQYFIPEVLKAIEAPMNIVDAGACEGELNRAMSELRIPVNQWFCFEADPINYSSMRNRVARTRFQDRQILVRKGLWSKNGTVYFAHDETGTSSRVVDHKTDTSIDAVTLDTYFEDCRIDFLKMNIEGAEIPALKGGLNVIKRDRPIVAVSIYHSLTDFYNIPEILMNELNGYTWYVRHHSLIFCETVLYGIPNR